MPSLGAALQLTKLSGEPLGSAHGSQACQGCPGPSEREQGGPRPGEAAEELGLRPGSGRPRSFGSSAWRMSPHAAIKARMKGHAQSASSLNEVHRLPQELVHQGGFCELGQGVYHADELRWDWRLGSQKPIAMGQSHPSMNRIADHYGNVYNECKSLNAIGLIP